METKQYEAILADLDGTVNRGDVLIEGVKEVYTELTAQGVRWLFLSNNASSLAEDLARKLERLGIPVSDGQIVNSASALIRALETEHPGARVMVVGQQQLAKGVERAGAVVETDPSRTDIVVTAMDRTFTYEKLALAHLAIQYGALFWATNLDPTFPVADGFRPGAGAIAAAVATAAGRPPDRVFGKPSPDMAWIALERLGLPAESCLVVGDRMETDILFARNAGMDSALVLTGATARSDLSGHEYRPDHVLKSIADVSSIMGRQAILD